MMKIQPYQEDLKKTWDDFVFNESCNGTFLQSWQFLDYHPQGRFVDASFFVKNEKDHILAVVPGCTLEEEGKKVFFSHKGSTFGGLVISGKYYRSADVFEMVEAVESHLQGEGYDKVVLKQCPSLFSRDNMDLLEYCLFQRGYGNYVELSTYVDLLQCPEDVLLNFPPRKRSYLRSAPCAQLVFSSLDKEKHHGLAYGLLEETLAKFQAKPVHTSEELQKLISSRIPKETEYFGVFDGETLVAMTLVFYFGEDIAHTQYLASVTEGQGNHGMMYLIYRLLGELKQRGRKILSFGISTEDCGSVLNFGLIRVKESYGSTYSTNKTYVKEFQGKGDKI